MKLTGEQIEKMEAGRELDALIAEIMERKPEPITVGDLRKRDRKTEWYSSDKSYSQHGWWSAEVGTDFYIVNGYYSSDRENALVEWRPEKEPSSDIAAAWEVVEHLKEDLFGEFGLCVKDDSWEVSWDEGCVEYRFAHATTAPLAICKAALFVVTHGEPKGR